VGIVNLGSDRVVVRHNRVLGNDSLGVIVLRNLFGSLDPRIEPDADFNLVRGNVILQNGQHPDPVRAITPGADIVYDRTGMSPNRVRTSYRIPWPAVGRYHLHFSSGVPGGSWWSHCSTPSRRPTWPAS
jgi:hypothetical protein